MIRQLVPQTRSMNAPEALVIVQEILSPRRLSYIEETVLLQSWSGKLYREIASEIGYELSYVKDIGAQLWSALSEALGREVTKKNLQPVLKQFAEHENWSVTGGAQISPDRDALPSTGEAWRSAASSAILPAFNPLYPSRFLPPTSDFYINRPPIEDQAWAELVRPGSLIRIKAPDRSGKTSLVYQLLNQAQALGMRSVVFSLRQAEREIFRDLNRFLRWFCHNISRELGQEFRPDAYWDEELGSKISCTAYMQDEVLRPLTGPLVLVLDDVDRLFEHTELAQDFLSLLRLWHEEGASPGTWQKLRLLVVHSTEVYVPLQISQSPFNVGLPLQLPEFSFAQVQTLAERHHLFPNTVSIAELEHLFELTGGHPFRIQLAFYWLRQGTPIAQLLAEAPTQAGIYADYLRQRILSLSQHPALLVAFQQVVLADQPVLLEAIAAYQLESMSLVKLNGNEATVSCELYRHYFRAQFSTDRLLSNLLTNRLEQIESLERRNRELLAMVDTDSLTNLANRRYLSNYLQYQEEQAIQNQTSLSVIFCDIDCFKQYNETYGHLAGDECLQWVATALRDVVKRPIDLVARYGGEEFVVILPMTDSSGALQIAEAIRLRIKSLEVPNLATLVTLDSPILTVSLGVSTCTPTTPGQLNELITAADQALYQSKRDGRDRIAFRVPVVES